ncbi:MAG: hypothetical protein NC340_00460 [Ruminococcus flavefaciens]|nr:hypothetical protein [Ruminococcus flavefaciens]MCM1228584.1 hypothetical protein [Ruminococcus flavefaciens]
MDIKSKIDELVNKVKNDKDFGKKFQENPTKAVEGILGVDLPDDQINKIIDGIKAKISIDDIGSKLGGLFNKVKK